MQVKKIAAEIILINKFANLKKLANDVVYNFSNYIEKIQNVEKTAALTNYMAPKPKYIDKMRSQDFTRKKFLERDKQEKQRFDKQEQDINADEDRLITSIEDYVQFASELLDDLLKPLQNDDFNENIQVIIDNNINEIENIYHDRFDPLNQSYQQLLNDSVDHNVNTRKRKVIEALNNMRKYSPSEIKREILKIKNSRKFK